MSPFNPFVRRARQMTMPLAVVCFVVAGCSNAESQITDVAGPTSASEPTVAGVTTEALSTTAPTTTEAPTTTTSTAGSSTVGSQTPTSTTPTESVAPTGLAVPILSFADSIELIAPDGTVTLIQRDEAVRVAGDTLGGVVFQRKLVAGPQSSILWQPTGASVPEALLIPEADQQIELHGVTTVTNAPEAVFSVTSPESSNRSLNRINLETGVVTELAVVDDAEFGSKSTQVDGPFIVTTWERPTAAGWTVYQSGTGRAIGGSFPDVEASCAAGVGTTCVRLASLSLDIDFVFRIVPHSTEAPAGSYDLVVSRSENGIETARVDLTSLTGEWYPEHMSELEDGRILLSRSVDPGRVRPTTGVVIDPESGSIEPLSEVGFVRLP